MSRRIAIDFGNNYWKWVDLGRPWQYDKTLAALAILPETVWRGIVARGRLADGYALVNGVPIAYGSMARRHSITRPPAGSARYNDAYLGLAVPAILGQIYQRSVSGVALRVLFPPGDIDYIPELRAALFNRGSSGIHQIYNRAGEITIELTSLSVIDEPLAGLACALLTREGNEKKVNPLAGLETLMVDVGGYTIDAVPVETDGQPDLTAITTIRGVGANRALDDFERAIRSTYKTRFKGVDQVDPLKLIEAIRTGQYRFGKINLDVNYEADEALNMLANETAGLIDSMGGPANIDIVLLTGGGSLLVVDKLIEAFPTIDFVMANSDDKDVDLQGANVYGAAKSWELMRRLQRNGTR